jgi:hypothetical protein
LISKISTLFHTLSYLKPIQAIYQLKNRVSKVGTLSSFEIATDSPKPLDFFNIQAVHRALKIEENQFRFEFLNLARSYHEGSIDWNDQSHGKLWNYNLQYLDFLRQEDIPVEVKVTLLKDLYSWLWAGKLPLEPYPVSLRVMNTIRFLETNLLPEDDAKLLKSFVAAEVSYLSQNLEYHILANHLLENAFALWTGANYFGHSPWIAKAERLLRKELEEQILPDGAHYELAPMYHQIILFRVLEAYQLTSEEQSLKPVLKEKAELMLGWLEQMTFDNGTLPHFNDTTEGIGMSPSDLMSIGKSIGLVSRKVDPKESGYRILQVNEYKLIADLEGIRPSYQPGHAHADTFSFVLHCGNTPIIVDPGISTYTIGERRSWERSTLAHNTLTIDRQNSSEVWSGFRVGRRARVNILEDKKNFFSARHDGYGKQIHLRTFEIDLKGFIIRDQVSNSREGQLLEVKFHLHPDIVPTILDSSKVAVTDELNLMFDGAASVTIENYEFCLGYNMLKPAKCLLVTLKNDTLITRLHTHR